jgi:hypothetical protein
MSKLQEKPSALKREHPALQNFFEFFLCLWVIFALLNPDPDRESVFGSWGPSESGFGSITLEDGMFCVYRLISRARAPTP